MIIFISMFSFFLDGILSKYISGNSLFLPLLTIVSLVIIYPYFNNNDYRYYKYIAILGFLYDIAYMNTVFYNFFIFIILGFINVFIKYYVSDRLHINVLITVLLIVVYRFINYAFINIIGNNLKFSYFFESVYSSLILNIFYCISIYLITDWYSKKYKIIKSR